MKKQVYFLKDSRINDWLIQGFKKRNFPVSFLGMAHPPGLLTKSRISRILSLHSRYIRVSLKGLFMSRNGDIIICFLDVLGLYVFLFSKVLLQKRQIVVINIMFNEGPDLLTSVKKALYKVMLRSRRVYPTVTSGELPGIYKRVFNIPDKEFHLIHDCYGDLDQWEGRYGEGNYVFCGGINGRDWETLKKAALLLPDVRFVVIGPKRDTIGEPIPNNIDYAYNLPYKEFQKLIQDCSIVALPLNTEAPAGLIVIFSSGLMRKPIISTDSYTLREYVSSGNNGFLIKMSDHVALAEKIRELLGDPDKRHEFGEQLYQRVTQLGDPDVFVNKLINIVEKIEQTNN